MIHRTPLLKVTVIDRENLYNTEQYSTIKDAHRSILKVYFTKKMADKSDNTKTNTKNDDNKETDSQIRDKRKRSDGSSSSEHETPINTNETNKNKNKKKKQKQMKKITEEIENSDNNEKSMQESNDKKLARHY